MWVELQQKSEASVTVKEAFKAKLFFRLLTVGSVFLCIFEPFAMPGFSCSVPKF